MFKAVTLIETLTTIVILLIAIHLIKPSYFYLSNKIKVENEAELVRSFIYQVKNYAQITRNTYHFTISQTKNRWCMLAVEQTFTESSRNSPACNCINLSSCNLKQRYFYYGNTFNTEIRSNSLYPAIFIRINALSGNLESKCFVLKADNEHIIIGIDPYGIIYVPSPNERSECKKLI